MTQNCSNKGERAAVSAHPLQSAPLRSAPVPLRTPVDPGVFSSVFSPNPQCAGHVLLCCVCTRLIPLASRGRRTGSLARAAGGRAVRRVVCVFSPCALVVCVRVPSRSAAHPAPQSNDTDTESEQRAEAAQQSSRKRGQRQHSQRGGGTGELITGNSPAEANEQRRIRPESDRVACGTAGSAARPPTSPTAADSSPPHGRRLLPSSLLLSIVCDTAPPSCLSLSLRCV